MKVWRYPGQLGVYMKPMTNAFTAKTMRAVPNLEGLRLAYEYNHPKADGMDEFIKKYLPDIRANNPRLDVRVHRSYVPCDTFLEAFYEYARFRVRRMNYSSAEQVLAQVQQLAEGGHWRGKPVKTFKPFGQYVKHYETKGQDVYKVQSRRHALVDDES